VLAEQHVEESQVGKTNDFITLLCKYHQA